MLDSAVEVVLSDGRELRGETELSRGHPGNPLNWAELEAKFLELAAPQLGDRAGPVIAALRDIDTPGGLGEFRSLLRA